MKKLLISSAAILVLLVVANQKDHLLTTILQRGIESRLETDLVSELADGLHLGLCGAGGPLPAPTASGPCVVVIAGTRTFVVDAGTNGLRNLNRMGVRTGQIEALFLTHFHSDHIDGLGEMATIRWVSEANTTPLSVHGPTGVAKVVQGFNMAYSFDAEYRHAHHGDTVAPLSGAGMVVHEFPTPELGVITTLVEEQDLKIEVFAVGHAPVEPAVGYRFTYRDRTLLITGDTIAMDNVREFAQGVDLLVHEALAPNLVTQMNRVAKTLENRVLDKVTLDILDYHATPIQAADVARDAGVGHLLYYHIVPPLVIPGQESLYLNGAQKVFSNYTVGRDGVFISLPAGTREINTIRTKL